MDTQELAKKLMGIAKGSSAVAAIERACWFDGEECPYGKPGGQFMQRPAVFCRMPKEGESGRKGCAKTFDHRGELLEFSEIHVEGICENLIEPNELESLIGDKGVRLAAMVAKVADNYKDKTQKETLKLAGEILAGEEENDERNPEVIMSSELDALL